MFNIIAKGMFLLRKMIREITSPFIKKNENNNIIVINNIYIQNNIIKEKINEIEMVSNPSQKKKKTMKMNKKYSKDIKNEERKKTAYKRNEKLKIYFPDSSKKRNFSMCSKNPIQDMQQRENETMRPKEEDKKFDDFELNQLEYEQAVYYDKRTFFQIYKDILSREHLLIFTFFVCNDYNLSFIKYTRFVFLFSTDMAINVFFFSDDSMHKIFLNYGKYNFVQQIPQIIYTTIISQLIEVFLCYLSLTDKHIYKIKKVTHTFNKVKFLKTIKCMKIKFIIFFIFTFIFFVFYWYTITSFCAVYENTQITFIKDSLFSFLLGILYPFVLYLIPSTFRIIALRKKKMNLKCLYKLSNVIPFF